MKYLAMLTDFGTQDHYVAVMKSWFLSHIPGVFFIDISHEVPPQSISSAAYLLYAAWDYLPENCLVLALVDPGVGTERRISVLECSGRVLVCPDNGISGLLLSRLKQYSLYEPSDALVEKVKIGKSTTFHGRDIFTPLCGWIIEKGIEHPSFSSLENPVRLAHLEPVDPQGFADQCHVIHIDHFGNIITNVKMDQRKDHSLEGLILQHRFIQLHDHYSQVSEGDFLSYWGSSGFLEIACRNSNAAKELGIGLGDILEIKYQEDET
ncbi:MAG: SAM-dependent chlorinase/fluorinase [Spirochaetales bacterium]|nr:SAM-dependent chlorinase/fluorinase [Spirochaetales bacterium]